RRLVAAFEKRNAKKESGDKSPHSKASKTTRHGGGPPPLGRFLPADSGTSKSCVASARGASNSTSYVRNSGWPTGLVGVLWPSKPSIRTTSGPPGVAPPLFRVSKTPFLISAKPP